MQRLVNQGGALATVEHVWSALTALIFIKTVKSNVADLQVRELRFEVIKRHPSENR